MDKNAQDIVAVFANGKPVEPPPGSSNPSAVGGSFRHDGLAHLRSFFDSKSLILSNPSFFTLKNPLKSMVFFYSLE